MKIKTLKEEEMAKVFEKSGYKDCAEIDFLCWNNIYEIGFSESFFFCVFSGDTLVGVAKLKTKGKDSICYPGFYNWLSFLSVKEGFKGKGISKILIDEMFSFIEKEKLDHLLISGYTEDGFNYLKPYLNKKAKEINLKFQDSSKVSF
ncbi:MAG: GNAT family N-acetyltransferase [Sulfurihydrogenibium sp.]|jgi:GNAT superfamily N-acetyltransferase|nr:GNAT family N-acetyltransferase [Sulfurihydrogenibium sp.]